MGFRELQWVSEYVERLKTFQWIYGRFRSVPNWVIIGSDEHSSLALLPCQASGGFFPCIGKIIKDLEQCLLKLRNLVALAKKKQDLFTEKRSKADYKVLYSLRG